MIKIEQERSSFSMDVQKCAHLIHDWVRDHGLHETCATRLAEFGAVDKTPLAFSLGELLQAVSDLLMLVAVLLSMHAFRQSILDNMI